MPFATVFLSLLSFLIASIPGFAIAAVTPFWVHQAEDSIYRYCGVVDAPVENVVLPTPAGTYRHFAGTDVQSEELQLFQVLEDVVDSIESGDHRSLRQSMAKSWRKGVGRRVVKQRLQRDAQVFGENLGLELLEVHIGDFPEPLQQDRAIGLVPIAGRSEILPSPISIVAPLKGTAAVALFKRKSQQNQAFLVLILQPDSDKWRYVTHCVNSATGAGRTYAELMAEVERFSLTGQDRNAYFLNIMATNLLVQPFMASHQFSERHARSMQEQPEGITLRQETLVWEWKGRSYPVFLTNFISVRDEAMLEIRYLTKLADLQSDEAVNERRLLAEFLCATYPEYVEVFDGVFIAAVDKQHFGFRDLFVFAEQEFCPVRTAR